MHGKMFLLGLLAVGAAAQSLPPATSPGQGIVDSAKEAYEPVVTDIVAVLENNSRRFQSLMVRLAWHTMAVYRRGEQPPGGSNGGCIRHAPQRDEADNAGLDEVKDLLEPVKTAHSWITYADMYVLAGTVAIEFAGGPTLHYQPGRRDFMSARVIANRCPSGRLPQKHINNDEWPHTDTQQYLYDLFQGLGLHTHTDAQPDTDGLHRLVAVMGGHTLGGMHNVISGNGGVWTTTPGVFNNEFFQLLRDDAWGLETQSISRDTDGPMGQSHTDLQYEGVFPIAMLPVDIALKHNVVLNEIVNEYAADEGLFFYHFAEAWKIMAQNGWVVRTARTLPRS